MSIRDVLAEVADNMGDEEECLSPEEEIAVFSGFRMEGIIGAEYGHQGQG